MPTIFVHTLYKIILKINLSRSTSFSFVPYGIIHSCSSSYKSCKLSPSVNMYCSISSDFNIHKSLTAHRHSGKDFILDGNIVITYGPNCLAISFNSLKD